MPNRIDMIYAFGGSCFGEHYIHCMAQHYMSQTICLNLIVESGTRCLQLIVCLVEPYGAGHFCHTKNKMKNLIMTETLAHRY